MSKSTQFLPTMKATLGVLAICASSMFCTSLVYAEENGVFVIVNTKNKISLTKQQIRNVFMGSASNLGLRPATLSSGEISRTVFNLKVVGLTESRIQSYWAQMRFSGRMKPPLELDGQEDVVTYVSENEDAIAYVSSSTKLPQDVRVILEVN